MTRLIIITVVVFIILALFSIITAGLYFDTVSLGLNSHCGFYTGNSELASPCKCLGFWTKGKLINKSKEDNWAYCQGITLWTFVK